MYPASISARVGHDTITKVSRLFNGSIDDILNEILQNARRAGAQFVDITFDTRPELDEKFLDGRHGGTLRIADNGCGILDPQDALTLGRSDWSEETARLEDAAGMGLFSLANHVVRISSRHRNNAVGWKAELTRDCWTGKSPIAIEECNRATGTSIEIDLPGQTRWDVHVAATNAIRFFPICVNLMGDRHEPQDFLAGAEHITEWNGNRIGVFNAQTDGLPKGANFHGLRVTHRFPELSQSYPRSCAWITAVDLNDAANLKMVLPARKEFMRNDALDELERCCRKAIFETIAKTGSHNLSYKLWKDARDFGIDLPEATPCLDSWMAKDLAGEQAWGQHKIDTRASRAILVETQPSHIETAFDRATANHALRPYFAEPTPDFEGYSWYDKLETISNFRFYCDDGKSSTVITGIEALPEATKHTRCESIELHFTLAKANSEQDIPIQTDVAITIDDSNYGSDLEGVCVFYVPNGKLNPTTLTNMLDVSAFQASQDSDSDSYDTQHEYFLREARALACTLLIGEEAAVKAQIEDMLHRNSWALPTNTEITISIGETFGQLNVMVAPKQAQIA